MSKKGFGVVVGLLFLLSVAEVSGNTNPYQIWVPYVKSPEIFFDGQIDTLQEWAGAGRYDISDLRGSLGDPPEDTGSVFLYAFHNGHYLNIAIANLADESLKVGDIVGLWTDDDNDDELDPVEEGLYNLKHYTNGDSVVFFPYGQQHLVTDFDIGVSATFVGYVCFEAAIRLGSTENYELACTQGESFGAWIGVKDVHTSAYNAVWPPTSNFFHPEYYGDIYLAMPDEPPPPASPTSVAVRVNRPGSVVIEWNNPVLNMIGDSLEGLDSVRVYRNGVKVHSIHTTSNGEHLGWVDTEVQLARSYSYRLSAVGFDRLESPLTEPQYAVPGYLYYSSDFEDDDGGWIPAVGDTWEWGEPQNVMPGRAYSGARCWATDLDDYYGSNVRWQLTGSPISFEHLGVSRAVFCFWHFCDTEIGFDGGNAKISTDGGESWSVATPEGEYPIDRIVGLDEEPGFSGSSGAWVYSVFDLSDYVGEAVQARFDFGSDGSTEFPGWCVDDIVVVANSPGVGVEEVGNPGRANATRTVLSVSPNPSRGRAAIAYQLSRPERVGLYIYDLAGRRIVTLHEGNQKAGTYSAIWDGTDRMGVGVSSGVYICRLNIGASFKAEKLLLIK